MPATIPPRRVLQGSGIHLEPMTPDDLPELFAAIGVPEVFAGGYGGGPAGYRDTIEAFVEFGRGFYQWDSNVYAVRLPDGELVGTSTLADFDERREHVHLGWTAYAPRVWGTGVNPETKLLMLGEAFAHGFGRVKLQADAVNARSRAAILKLGARFEGVVRRDMPRPDGTWRDSAVYSILAEEWPGIRERLSARVARYR